MTQTPQTLDELGEGLLLWEHLNTELPSIDAKISPLFDQFAILDKYEVSVSEDVRSTLMDLPNKFRDFQQTLVDADIMLKKHKVRWSVALRRGSVDKTSVFGRQSFAALRPIHGCQVTTLWVDCPL